MSKEKRNNLPNKSIYDRKIRFSSIKRFNSLSENVNLSNKKQKKFFDTASHINFNFFNIINSPFSNSLQEIETKNTKAFTKDSNFLSSLLSFVNKEEDDYDTNNKKKTSINSQNEEKEDNGNIFAILSKHLIYQSNDSDLNENSDSESEKNIKFSENKNSRNEDLQNEQNDFEDNNFIFNDYDELNQEDKIILNNFLNLAKKQSSCRFLQQKLNICPYLVKYFFSQIIQNIHELIIHPYGNYLIQNIFIYLSENQISEFVNEIKNNITNISMNFYGTRVIQKLIDFIHNQNIMLNLLNGYKNYSIIANDVFASHIIIKLLSFNKIYINCYIYEKINDDLVEISMNRHGCCVLTKILESKSSFNDIIINNIINNLMTLIIDQYGHYLILYIIKSDLRSYKRKLIMNIIPNFTYLAIQIYSSTVLEKCFEFCEDDIKYILYQHLENVDTIKTLICDEYGNYVIQKAILKTPNDNIRYVLFRNIFSIINDIKNDNFGRQFFVKLCKQYPLFQKLISNP